MNVGVIGLGVGERHVSALQNFNKVKKILVTDFNRRKLDEIVSSYSKTEKSSEDQIMNDHSIDLIVIASFDQYHSNQVITAIENKKHVFVEKPICLTEEELSKIKAAYLENQEIQISSNFILRKENRFINLKREIDSGKMGKIYYIEATYDYGRLDKIINGWRGEIEHYSVMLGGGIHLLDLMTWITGAKIKDSYGLGSKFHTRKTKFIGPDLAVALLELEGGIIGKITANFASSTPHFHQLKFYGSKGTFIHDCNEGRYFFDRDTSSTMTPDKHSFPSTSKGDLLIDFVNSIINKKPHYPGFNQILELMDGCFMVDKSLKLIK